MNAAVIGREHPLDWIVIGAASVGGRYFQPEREHLRRLLDLMDDTGTPVFFKGNLRAAIGGFCNGRLDRWREDFPRFYRDGCEIPAVVRRQRLCRQMGWTESRAGG